MKRAGLYDQYRYPNKLYLSNDTVHTQQTSVSSTAAGSARPSYVSAYKAGLQSSGRNSPVQSVSSQQSVPIHTYPAPANHRQNPYSNNYATGTAGVGSFEIHDEDYLIPRRRIVTRYGWIAFVLQLFSFLLVVAVFLGPGWGRSKRDARTSDEKGFVHNYHGFWFRCSRQTVGSQVTCVTDLYVDKEAWWIVVQVLACIFLVLTFISLLLICFYVFRIKSNRKWTLSLSHSICSILNCLALATCIVVFAVNFKDNSWWCCPKDHRIIESILYWAWYLAIVALLSQLIALAMTIAETCKLRT